MRRKKIKSSLKTYQLGENKLLSLLRIYLSNIEDVWYEFNDRKVQKVLKTYAFNKGIRSLDADFDILKIGYKDYNLNETFE